MAVIDVICKSCNRISDYRNGKSLTGKQRYPCKGCRHCFPNTSSLKSP
ncbi:IS1 family transposase [Leucothrix pacifica]|uniref:InsA N-terminal zinc ribbon domain-containing protein n=1 Tax=Leucothrix pacifica TaxID=1247513 RepID=A0A317CHQ6_9GAMM|nr:hypothetical protein DKW60_13955 [Leucothrix pacifica]